MLQQIDIAEVQAHLVELLEKATPGDEIVITRDGKQFGKLLPAVNVPTRPRASLEEFKKALDEFARGSEGCLSGYQGTYSREDIYSDHD